MALELKQIIEQEQVPYPDKEKLFLVLGLLLSGKISMGKAAELLDLRVDELWLLLQKLGVKYNILSKEEVEDELDAFKRVFKSST